MKTTMGRLKSFIAEATVAATGLLAEATCKTCGDENEYAESNQSDGSFICARCRSEGKGKHSAHSSPVVTPSSKPTTQPQPDAGPFKVLEDDGHGQMSVHVFRDQRQFTDYMLSNGDFDEDDFDDNGGEYTDENDTRWSKFTGHYEHDHRKDP